MKQNTWDESNPDRFRHELAAPGEDVRHTLRGTDALNLPATARGGIPLEGDCLVLLGLLTDFLGDPFIAEDPFLVGDAVLEGNRHRWLLDFL